MKANFCVFIFLVLASFNKEVSADSADCNDSLICGNKTNEILFISAVMAVCVLFFIQCIVIICLAYKLNQFYKRIERINLSRGTYTYHTTYPHLSAKQRALEETEDVTYMPSRVRRFTGTFPDSNGKSSTFKENDYSTELTIVDNPANANEGKEIWGLY